MHLLSGKRGITTTIFERNAPNIRNIFVILSHFKSYGNREGSWDTREDWMMRFAKKKTREGVIKLPGRRSYCVHCCLLNYCQPRLLDEPLLFSSRFICLFNRRKLFEYFLKKSLNVPQYDISIFVRHRVHLIFFFSTRVSSTSVRRCFKLWWSPHNLGHSSCIS